MLTNKGRKKGKMLCLTYMTGQTYGCISCSKGSTTIVIDNYIRNIRLHIFRRKLHSLYDNDHESTYLIFSFRKTILDTFIKSSMVYSYRQFLLKPAFRYNDFETPQRALFFSRILSIRYKICGCENYCIFNFID
jgi:hypothetical protein